MPIDSHETFMQQTMALAGALRWLRCRCNFKCGDGAYCEQIIERADNLYAKLQAMPEEKKEEFNRLF